MAPVIGDPIPAGWSGNKFNLLNNGTGTAMDCNGSDLWNWEYNDSNDNQVWLLTLIDRNANIWTLQSPLHGKFLDLQNGSTAPGTAAQPWNRTSDGSRHNQEWYIYLVEDAGGSARIALQNVGGGTFLNLTGGDRSNGSKIAGYPWNAGNDQIWRLVQQI